MKCYVRHEVAPGVHQDIPHTHEEVTMKDEKQPTYRVTVEFTDGEEPVTATGVEHDALMGFYSIIGDEEARARMQRDDGVHVMFPGKYIRFIYATPEPVK